MPPATALADLQHALQGRWVGVLEYRDYSEPASSSKRVKLPTWLEVSQSGVDLQWHFVYDDGPAKTVTDDETVSIDIPDARYKVRQHDGKEELYIVSGLQELKMGRGTLTLTGPGTESGRPVSIRITLRVGRNLLEMTRESAPGDQPFAFRDAYTLVRATPPGVAPN